MNLISYNFKHDLWHNHCTLKTSADLVSLIVSTLNKANIEFIEKMLVKPDRKIVETCQNDVTKNVSFESFKYFYR